MKLTHIFSVIGFFLISVIASVRPASAAATRFEKESHSKNETEAPDPNLEIRDIDADKAYSLLEEKKTSSTVIVAVIDSGVDVEHEDLKEKIWINEDEIADNGIDDDKNGYVDDIYGWNFIGGKDGKNVEADTYELTRLYVQLQKKYDGVVEAEVPKKKRDEYNRFLELKNLFEKKVKKVKMEYFGVFQMKALYQEADKIMKAYLGKEEYTIAEVVAVQSNDRDILFAKNLLSESSEIGYTADDLEEGEEHFRSKLQFGLNPNFEPRDVVGDNYEDVSERYYGNNDVTGPDAKHGTHVAGIIAADRNNNLGMKGVADNVKIMAIRAVPNGDERDKDIANAVYYAVDNGAKIINMSFGKDFSPQKEAVDAAVKYAETNGVLIIHAAGNESKNIDEVDNFPTKTYLKSGKKAKNWIEVGASDKLTDTESFTADFSNYGQNSVDIFAPGTDIYSTIPGQKYKNESGTSMAAPVVSGVAALIMSYFPEMNAEEVKELLLNSSVKYSDLKVNTPGKLSKSVEFGKLSNTGGVVNAERAVEAALAL